MDRLTILLFFKGAHQLLFNSINRNKFHSRIGFFRQFVSFLGENRLYVLKFTLVEVFALIVAYSQVRGCKWTPQALYISLKTCWHKFFRDLNLNKQNSITIIPCPRNKVLKSFEFFQIVILFCHRYEYFSWL